MGSIIGWHCNDCGSKESFFCGGGMLGFNQPSVVERSKNGTFGPAMKQLFGGGIPKGWTVFTENAFYRCPHCDSVIESNTFRIDDDHGGWLVYHMKPKACETCKEELFFWDDKVPMTEKELRARCRKYSDNGCPKCGGKNISIDWGEWD